MNLGLATGLAPVSWGMIVALILFIAVVVACIDPEITEAYVGNPPTLLFATLFGVVVVAVLLGWLRGAVDAATIWGNR